LGQLGCDHDLRAGDGSLGVVALQGSTVAVHEAAVGVGGVGGRLGVGGLIAPAGSDVGPGPLAAGPGGGGQLGDSLLVALLAGGGLGFQVGLGLLQPGQPLSPTSQRPWQLAKAAVLLIVSPVGRGGLGEQLGDLGLQSGVGAVGRGGGVGLDLGPVQGDQPQPDHPGRRAQLERLDQEALHLGSPPGRWWRLVALRSCCTETVQAGYGDRSK